MKGREMTKQTIEPKAFRRALGNFATGVTIITARAPDGTTVGVTASSFNSLSMDPPLIIWSSMKETPSCAVFERATHFAVNILAADQLEMSNHFARQKPDKFEGVEHEQGIGGAPIFPNCAGRFQCETYDKLDGGDHWIFVGRVLAFDDFGRAPLCFHQGSYAMVYNHPDSFPKSLPIDISEPREGKMANHSFFLMLRAVRAYQTRYQPKMASLGLSVIEARILLVLNDLNTLEMQTLGAHLHTPETETNAALTNLIDRGLIRQSGECYDLTEEGRTRADQCWNVADAHASEAFAGLEPSKVEAFDEVLRHLIGK
jgi:flavin reductase (DIM6/NTAB) family NADH-FMN oxidoreductase RutF/DNA-binding MarR family transcriptional regulator